MHSWKTAVRIAVVSASIIAASAIAIGTLEPPGIDALSATLAWMSARAAGMLGIPASLDGAVIDADGFVAVIAAQCTAIEIILVFGAAVLVWPVSLRARMLGLLLGITALCALNFARIVSLLWVGAAYPQHFDTAHLAVWQTGMVLAGFVIWLLWMRWASNVEDGDRLAA